MAVKNGWIYAIWGDSANPTTWREQNVTINGQIRQLSRRMIAKQESVVEEEKQKSAKLEQRFAGRVAAKTGFEISGQKADVDRLILHLEDFVKNPRNFSSTVKPLRPVSDAFVAMLKKIVMGKVVDIVDVRRTKPGDNAIRIEGYNHQEAKLEVHRIIEEYSKYNFPDEWEDIHKLFGGGGDALVIKEVNQMTPEFQKIAINFKRTQPAATITRVQRIQNKRLWKIFNNEKEDIA